MTWKCGCGHELEESADPADPPHRCKNEGCPCDQCRGCHSVAFTVGSPETYDKISPGTKKLGRREPSEEYPDGYGGGIVFPDAAAGAEWARKNGFPYEVYRIALPSPWSECVGKSEYAGVEHDAILVDCVILGRA